MKFTGHIIILLIFLLFASSCKKSAKSDTIPERKLVPLLVDIHLLNGAVNTPTLYRNYAGLDSAAIYAEMFGRYGVDKPMFDKTMDYYSSRPDKLEKIYSRVLHELSRLESELQQESEIDAAEDDDNLWNQKYVWNLPADGLQNKLEFDIPLHGPGTYTISFRLRVFEDDQSLNPRLTAYFWQDDGTEEGNRIFFPEKSYTKSSHFVTVSIARNVDEIGFRRLKGALFDHSPREGSWSKHAIIRNIEIRYQPPKTDLVTPM